MSLPPPSPLPAPALRPASPPSRPPSEDPSGPYLVGSTAAGAERRFNPLRPWRHPVELWRLGCYIVTGFPIHLTAFILFVTLASVTIGMLITFVLALPFAWAMLVGSRGFARLERNRVAALAAVAIEDPVPPLEGTSAWKRLWERLRSAPRWRELAFHLIAWLPSSILFGLVTAIWCGSWAMLALPAYVNGLPGNSAKFHGFEVAQGWGAAGAAGVGLIGVALVAPWFTVAAARANLALAQALLGPTAEDRVAAERLVTERIEQQRGAAVDSAEAERRRIERDLHDGAQQRLVALAAGLGAARAKLDADGARTDASPVNDAEARRLVADAHEEAKAALKEIRDLVRGIHPVILEDRGLDAALSAVVARSPIPVALQVDLTERLPASVESAAYFVVTEALANVAKHSNATRAKVSIARAGDRLVLEIHDNGEGGADPAAGTGLRGLRDRVEALGGVLFVVSPPGGPTSISVEVPCGS